MALSTNDKLFDELYTNVKKYYLQISNGKLNVDMIIVMSRYAMELVQTSKNWKKLKGHDKKVLVMSVITHLVKDLINDKQVVGDIGESEKMLILAILEHLPSIIDAIVDYSKMYRKSWTRFFKCSCAN